VLASNGTVSNGMDIKDMDKSQMVLLTILICFVISIATSITTVTLMQEVPLEIIQPVSKVIRETVEKVVPVETRTEVKTVLIKEEDLIVTVIAGATPALVSAKEKDGETSKGFLISSDGMAIVAGEFDKDASVLISVGEKIYGASVLGSDPKGFSVLRIIPDKSASSTVSVKFPFISFVNMTKMQIGNTLIAMSSNDITTGIFLSPFSKKIPQVATSTTTSTETSSSTAVVLEKELIYSISINTNLPLRDAVLGNPVLNTNEEMVGMILEKSGNPYVLSAEYLASVIREINSSIKKIN